MKFFVNKSTTSYGQNEEDLSPRVADSFLLKYTAWDDYSLKCEFKIYYCKQDATFAEIGRVKIFHSSLENKIKELENANIVDNIPDEFDFLDENYCSLGQFVSYYETIKFLFPTRHEEVLKKLRDCATNSSILEKFSLEYPLGFNRIARREEAQEALLKARALLKGINLAEIHKFSYYYTPPYGSEKAKVDLHFDNVISPENRHASFRQRIYALIGKNGTGKTTLLNNLARDLLGEAECNFAPNLPIFQKIMYISSSCFDNEPSVDKSDKYNYIYSGISNSNKERVRDFIKSKVEKSFNLVKGTERVDVLVDSLERLFSEPDLKEFFNEKGILIEKILDALDYLSSGECIQIMHLFSIVSNIFSGTLLLFDEPETHLHPNAITRLISTLIYILEKYNSYAIISTHSPLIVQNLRAKEVIVAEKYGDNCRFETLDFESLGTNLSQISDRIFHNDMITPAYKEKIILMKKSGIKKPELIAQITPNQGNMSLALSLFIDATYQHEGE